MTVSLEDLGPHVWRGRAARSADAVVATGFSELDRHLAGGWPWGAITEILVERFGVGELDIVMPALVSVSRRDAGSSGFIVFVAPPLIPYAPALSRRGVDLGRVLVVEASSAAAGPSIVKPGRAMLFKPGTQDGADALWATEQALRSGASAVVLAWLEISNDTVLRRLQLAAEEQRSALLLFRSAAAARQRSPAAARLRLSSAGDETQIEILKCRGGRPARLSLNLSSEQMAPRFGAQRLM